MTNFARGFIVRERIVGEEYATSWIREQLSNSRDRDEDESEQSLRKSKNGSFLFSDKDDEDIKTMYAFGYLNQEIANYLKLENWQVKNHISSLIKIGYMKKLQITTRRWRHEVLETMGHRGKYKDVELVDTGNAKGK